jgi:hypothetical protein
VKKRDIEKRDCKPSNYNYISTNLKQSRIFSGREEIVAGLEQLLLKSLLVPPPDEQPESIEFIRIFEGKRSMVLTFWLSELKMQRFSLNQLIRICRIKYN